MEQFSRLLVQLEDYLTEVICYLVNAATFSEDEGTLGHDDLARALREHSVAAGLQRDDGAHRFSGK